MCGICGFVDLQNNFNLDQLVLENMLETIHYRGPDSSGTHIEDHVALGAVRLSFLDLDGGHQPLFNEDKSIILVCNGEIFNYIELREPLIKKGHQFSTGSDVEVIIHLYEEKGLDFLNDLNGQFAFALFDVKHQKVILARDQAGICPLFYTVVDNTFIFGSEIKSILTHPLVDPKVDLVGLDQVFTFPGLISPRTMFENIHSLKSGHYIVIQNANIQINEYWDLDYPRLGDCSYEQSENFYVESLNKLLVAAVDRRLRADVPIGCYLSGGLDSSLIVSIVHQLRAANRFKTFSIGFTDKSINEAKHRSILTKRLNVEPHETVFDWEQISGRLHQAIYHSECPLKETYNTASLALSEMAHAQNIKAILTGEGADELFAGYIGYRFDSNRRQQSLRNRQVNLAEQALREKVWGDRNILYERDLLAYKEIKQSLYSDRINARFAEIDCLNHPIINKEKLARRHFIHQRSYLDFKLRMSDHLISDHGDRVSMANSVEARYPFLDKEVIAFATQVPPHLKLKDLHEKYILKEVAKKHLPRSIIRREKFAFHAPGSPNLLNQNLEWVHDYLSYNQIQRQGYFNPDAVEGLKVRYMQDGFRLNLPFEYDLLIIVLTFNMFLDVFNLN